MTKDEKDQTFIITNQSTYFRHPSNSPGPL